MFFGHLLRISKLDYGVVAVDVLIFGLNSQEPLWSEILQQFHWIRHHSFGQRFVDHLDGYHRSCSTYASAAMDKTPGNKNTSKIITIVRILTDACCICGCSEEVEMAPEESAVHFYLAMWSTVDDQACVLLVDLKQIISWIVTATKIIHRRRRRVWMKFLSDLSSFKHVIVNPNCMLLVSFTSDGQ